MMGASVCAPSTNAGSVTLTLAFGATTGDRLARDVLDRRQRHAGALGLGGGDHAPLGLVGFAVRPDGGVDQLDLAIAEELLLGGGGDAVGLVERGARRQLDVDDELAAVLGGDELVAHELTDEAHEEEGGEREQADEELVRDRPAEHAPVEVVHAVEHGQEAAF